MWNGIEFSDGTRLRRAVCHCVVTVTVTDTVTSTLLPVVMNGMNAVFLSSRMRWPLDVSRFVLLQWNVGTGDGWMDGWDEWGKAGIDGRVERLHTSASTRKTLSQHVNE